MTKRVMGSVRAELLKMKHTFLIPFHVAVPVIIAGFMLFYYRSGVTHSLSHASASGVYVARHILESEGKAI